MPYTKYPESLDDHDSLPVATDLVTAVKAEVVNRLRDAIMAVQAELAANPSGVFGTVRARLDAIDSEINSIIQDIENLPVGGGGGSDALTVKVSSDDSSDEFLEDKVVAGSNITITILNPSGNEQLEISAADPPTVETLTSDDKNLNPSATSGDGYSTDILITNTPFNDCYVSVFVNGIFYRVGDGVKTLDCYFSSNNGVTAKTIANITAGDELFWNGIIVGFDLTTTDVIDLLYEAG